jgi:hypothetical protein
MALSWNKLLTSSVGKRSVASAAAVRLDCARLCREENVGRGLVPRLLPRLWREEQRDDDFLDQHGRNLNSGLRR